MNWLTIGMGAVVLIWVLTRKTPTRTLSGTTSAEPCPRPTQDLALNTRNRDIAISSPHIQYGPLNLSDEQYWVRLGKHWNTSTAVAKKSRCKNCAAFDVSPRMTQCMPGAVQKFGRLGYCWLHKFKCHSERVCYTWIAGGPIDTNKVSYGWQKKGG
jgi:hypothetical protein